MSHDYWALTPRASALQQENPLEWEAHTPQRRVPPSYHNQRKSNHSNRGPAQPKGKYYPPIKKKKWWGKNKKDQDIINTKFKLIFFFALAKVNENKHIFHYVKERKDTWKTRLQRDKENRGPEVNSNWKKWGMESPLEPDDRVQAC